MATSGSAEVAFARHRLRIKWATASQNVANNTSLVNVWVYLVSVDAYGRLNAPASNAGSCTVNGGTTGFSATSDLSAYQEKLLYGKAYTIPHNADGTKSFTISATYNVNVTFSGVYHGNKTVSCAVNLNTIPRKSTASLSPSTLDAGKEMTIGISRASSAFTHTITYGFGTMSGTIATKTTATSVKWTPPLSLLTMIPTAVQGWGGITVTTYSGSTSLGSDTYKFNINCPASIVPSTGTIAFAETNATVTAVLGAQSGTAGTYLQNLSQVKYTITGATSQYGATIKSYAVSWGGRSFTASTGTHAGCSTAGAQTVTITVTDSRGRVKTATTKITYTAYSAPKFNSVGASRTNNGMGTTVTVRRGGTYSQILTNKNKVTVYFDYKTSASATAWTGYSALTVTPATNTGGTFTANGTTATSVYTFLTTNTYPIRIRAIDAFKSQATWEGTLNTAEVALSLGKTGVGVGRIWSQGAMDVGGDVYMNKNTILHGGIYSGTLPEGDTKTAAYWHSFPRGLTTYYTSSAVSTANNKPQQYGFVEVLKSGTVGSASDFRVKFYHQATGAVWVTSGNYNSIRTWYNQALDAYPVGSLYESTTATSPATLFGGTWARYGNGMVTVGVNESDTDFATAGKTGGAKSRDLRALIGAVNGDASSLGYKAVHRVPGYETNQYTYSIRTGTTVAISSIAHTTPVLDNNGKQTTVLQPYVAVYRWRRTA